MADTPACSCATPLSALIHRRDESCFQALPAEEAGPGGDNATAG